MHHYGGLIFHECLGGWLLCDPFFKPNRVYGGFVQVCIINLLRFTNQKKVGDQRQEPLVQFIYWYRVVSIFENNQNAVICTKNAHK